QAEKEAAARAERERARREREERERLETQRRESAARDKQRPKKTPPGDEQPKAKTPSKGDIKAYASDLVGGGEQFKCLDKLWERESNWNHTATNPTSGAYGIPQAYPGDKMASAGKDW